MDALRENLVNVGSETLRAFIADHYRREVVRSSDNDLDQDDICKVLAHLEERLHGMGLEQLVFVAEEVMAAQTVIEEAKWRS